MLQSLQADIISVCETHLRGSDSVSLSGYIWFGHNRQELHRNAPKGSGGVGIFLKNCLLELYDIKVIDRIID